jgi:hypothetical protein
VGELLTGADGQKAKILAVNVTHRCYSEENFAIMPLIIQTAGTITDSVAIAQPTQDVGLDSAIDDVFGYQPLSKFLRTSRRVPTRDAQAAAGTEHALQFAYTIPGNILQILNKELETERLQDLYVVLHGFHFANSQTINIHTNIELLFVNIRKNVNLR